MIDDDLWTCLLPADERLRRTCEEIDRLTAQVKVWSRLRERAVADLREDGRSLNDLVAVFPLTKSRYAQIVRGTAP